MTETVRDKLSKTDIFIYWTGFSACIFVLTSFFIKIPADFWVFGKLIIGFCLLLSCWSFLKYETLSREKLFPHILLVAILIPYLLKELP